MYDDSTRGLDLLGVDGALHALATLDTAPAGVADSPDGQSLVYSLVSWSGAGQSTGPIATSRIYVLAYGGAPRLVATLSRPNGTGAPRGAYLGGYRVLRWDAAGVLLGSDPTGVGGYGPFIGEGYGLSTVVRLDPTTGSVSSPLTPGCRFSDVAGDGTTACVSGSAIEVRSPSGSTRTIDTGAKWVGDVAFTSDSSSLTFSTAIYPQGEASSVGWFDHLFVVHLGGGLPAPRELTPPEGWRVSETFAFDRLLDPNTVAEVIDTSNFEHDTVELVDLTTGRTTPITPVDPGGDSIIGVP